MGRGVLKAGYCPQLSGHCHPLQASASSFLREEVAQCFCGLSPGRTGQRPSLPSGSGFAAQCPEQSVGRSIC